ncbi:MAG TPA: tRNA lysidine(34) synthetase TilS [Candidatus Omnitrophota bacterium]|nr:tRNA lysidine(34) synthetase TilS [Candidatus Omnitrophota bacterium]HQL40795.1 tRNA lysidine(34) synthetase TilS [Candidatus Omnitrophota bacterium]
MKFLEKITRFCLAQQLFSPGNKVVVGVSGGPDSMALLYILSEFQISFGIKMIVAHLNHGLRSRAVHEQKYVRQAAKKFNLPFFTKNIKIKDTKRSLEEKAREERLKFLCSVARRTRSQVIALGHHQDDLAETVLMRFLRGTGVDGARGILPSRILYGQKVVRPLLTSTRQEIEEFLKINNIRSFQDASNRNTKFLRNKIRLHLLPLIKSEYNPQIVNTLANFSQHLNCMYDYIHQEGLHALENASLSRGRKKTSIAIDLRSLKNFHQALLSEVIRLAIEKLLGHTRKLTTAHIDEVIDLINRRPSRSIAHLPNNMRVIKEQNRVIFAK